jgi:phage tail-like protein
MKAGFSECSGLSTETDVIEYRTGDKKPTVTKIPGLDKYTNIVLKRGFTADDKLWKWRKKVIDGQTERKSGTITLNDESGKAALRWNFEAGWPRKWDGPTLNAKTNEVAIETLEIAHEGLSLG